MRLLLPLLLAALVSTGCGARDAVSTASDCVGLARDVASTGLSGVPTRADVEQAVEQLDQRVQDLQDEQVKDAATGLRDRLRELQEAIAAADPAAVRTAAGRARDAARDTAEACGVPAGQFLG